MLKKTSFLILNIFQSAHVAFLCLLILAGYSAHGQMVQYHIGGTGNEMATKIKYLPGDTSEIIAGYSYDIVSGGAQNCQAILMKVKSNVIVWQKTFGVPARNNVIKDMIITNDNNIVVVGTVGGNGNVYADNTAAILKYNSTSGALMWQTCFRDAATTTGGELFYGVTQLNDGTNRLVAVGAHDLTGSGAGSMICVFQDATGTLIYNEVMDVPNGDEFQGVVTSATGNSVYMCGEFVGNYKDGRVMSYTPGTTSGTVNWEKFFDFNVGGIFQNNFLARIYLSGSKLVILGGNLQFYSTAAGEQESILTLNASDGGGAQIYGIQNSGVNYSNDASIAVATSDHIYNIQTPATTSYDATIWTLGATTDAVLTDITSLSSGTTVPPIRYTSTVTGQHALLDMQLNGSTLYMAGSTNIATGFGNNDIYYVSTGTNLSSTNHTCDTVHDNIAITPVTYTSAPPTYSIYNFTPTYITVDTSSTNYNIGVICGDSVATVSADTFCNTLTMPDSLIACLGSTIIMPAVLTGSDSVISYLWTPPTGLSSTTILNPTLSATSSGWCHLTVQSIIPANLVTNGDFSAGNTGFSTGYTVEPPAGLSTPDHYAVDINPSSYDAAFPSFGDHTTGTGNMLIVDGSPTPGLSFWCQTIPVQPNTDYIFTVWSALLHVPLPSIQININSTAVSTFAPSSTAGIWTKYSIIWNSGTATSANICMTDLNTASFGNDFVIDDISLQKICVVEDSIYVQVNAADTTYSSSDTTVCFSTNNKVTLTAPSGYTAYQWSTGPTTDTTSVSSGTYWVYASSGCNLLIDTFHITLLNDTMTLYNNDTAICRGASVQVILGGDPAISYQWRPTAGIPYYTVPAPLITPDTSAMYVVTAVMPGCPTLTDSFYIDVQPVPFVYAGGNRAVCQFDTLHLHASVTPDWYTHYIYNWTPATYLDDSTAQTVVFTPGIDTKLILTVTTPAGCIGKDSASITVHPGNFAQLDTTINLCPGDSTQIIPNGGASYMWHPGLYLSDSTSSQPWVHPITSQSYTVIATSQYGCLDTISATIIVHPHAVIYLTDSVTIYPGESYQINTQTNCTNFLWSPSAGLDNIYLANPIATPGLNTQYIVHASTEWGCQAIDSIEIYLGEPLLSVPNAFTPGSAANNILYIIKQGGATLNYFRIYNRWGNKVYESGNIDAGWDGTYKGVPQPFDVYVYVVEAVTSSGHVFHKQGNITLIR